MSGVRLAIFNSVLLSVPRLNAQAADNGQFLAGELSRQRHCLAEAALASDSGRDASWCSLLCQTLVTQIVSSSASDTVMISSWHLASCMPSIPLIYGHDLVAAAGYCLHRSDIAIGHLALRVPGGTDVHA
jgi:hypothetical protein